MNNIILSGNVCNDCEVHTMQSGVKKAQFLLAVNRDFVNSQGVRETDFFSCIAWRERAEFAEKYITKGKRLIVTGPMQQRKFEAQDGSKRTVYEVIIEKIEFTGAKNDSEKPVVAKKETTDVRKPEEMEEADDADLTF